jgi:hypothetical protein
LKLVQQLKASEFGLEASWVLTTEAGSW